MFSHSRISTFKLCPKQYEYKYIQNLFPLSTGENLILGKLWHKGIELKSVSKLVEYIDLNNESSDEKNETMITMALAMTEAYFNKFGYNENTINELYFEITLPNGQKLRGYIDALEDTPEGYWLHEYKTASMVNADYIDKLKFNDQLGRYMYALKNDCIQDFKLDKPILGIKYRICKKPLIRQKQNESIMEFRKRLVEKLSEEDNIIELILNRTDEDIENCILDTIQDIDTILNTTRFSKTLSACSTYGRCPYMELCSKEENAELLYIQRIEEEEQNNE